MLTGWFSMNHGNDVSDGCDPDMKPGGGEQ